MGWQWHQLDHMQIICTSLRTDNHMSTSSLNILQAGCSSWCPANSINALKAILLKFNRRVKTSVSVSMINTCLLSTTENNASSKLTPGLVQSGSQRQGNTAAELETLLSVQLTMMTTILYLSHNWQCSESVYSNYQVHHTVNTCYKLPHIYMLFRKLHMYVHWQKIYVIWYMTEHSKKR